MRKYLVACARIRVHKGVQNMFREKYLRWNTSVKCIYVVGEQGKPEGVQLSLVFKVAIHRRALIARSSAPSPYLTKGIPIYLLIFEFNKYLRTVTFLLQNRKVNS